MNVIIVFTTLFALVMITFIVIMRIKSANNPTSKLKIILPPLFMSTGALMFIFPYFQLSWKQVVEALSIGVLFSIFLIYTSKLEVRNQDIYLVPSRAFIYILFGLIIIRTIAKFIIGGKISIRSEEHTSEL